MSPLDLILLSFASLAALPAVLPARMAPTAFTRGALATAVLLCVLQLWVEGPYWQFAAAYALIGIGATAQVGARDRTRRTRLITATLAGLALIVLSASWVALPVPTLPQPSGPYPVGTKVFRWVLPDRDEPATASTDDRRNIIVQAWYPATPNATGRHATYLDGLGRLPSRVAGVPRAIFAQYARIDTHAIEAAPVNDATARWPVVIFSPGYGASRSFYTSLLGDLASRGVMVLAVDHPYEAALTQLADGRIVTTVERLLPGETDRIGYMIRQTDTRVADLRAVLEAMTAGSAFGALSNRMDLGHIAVAGHSFGGAAAVATAHADDRIRAAANIDGTLYGTVPDSALTQPFLLVQSDRSETKHGARFLDGHARLFARIGARGQRCELLRTNHYSFTDAPLLLSTPWRWIVSRVAGGSRGTAATIKLTNDVLMSFLATATAPSASSGQQRVAAPGCRGSTP